MRSDGPSWVYEGAWAGTFIAAWACLAWAWAGLLETVADVVPFDFFRTGLRLKAHAVREHWRNPPDWEPHHVTRSTDHIGTHRVTTDVNYDLTARVLRARR